MVRFGNNNFAVIAGYGDVVIGSTMIKKVYYVEERLNKIVSWKGGIELSAQVGDIVEFKTAIAQTFLYLRQ
nr:hypothetical protein [Tanacetum cinerariifolium]